MDKKRKHETASNITFKNKKSCKDDNNTNFVTSNMRCLNYENENLNIGGTNVSRFTSYTITMICNLQIQTQMTNTLYIDLGDCTYNCQYCGAFF